MGNESSIAQRLGIRFFNCCVEEKDRRGKLISVNAKPAFSNNVHTFDNKHCEVNNPRIWVNPATGPVVTLGPDFGNPFRQHSSNSSSGTNNTHTRIPRSATFAELLPNPKALSQNIVATDGCDEKNEFIIQGLSEDL